MKPALNEISLLRELVSDDEAIAEYTVAGSYYKGYCLVPGDSDLRYLDISRCLEETLHRIIDQDNSEPIFCGYSTDEVVAAVMLADKDPADEDEEGIEIDLGYRIHGPLMTFDLM